MSERKAGGAFNKYSAPNQVGVHKIPFQFFPLIFVMPLTQRQQDTEGCYHSREDLWAWLL
jgi:hypothetical protein